MTKQTDRVARMETKAFPPPLHKVRLGFQMAGDPRPPYPDDLSPDDMFIVVRGVAPKHELSS